MFRNNYNKSLSELLVPLNNLCHFQHIAANLCNWRIVTIPWLIRSTKVGANFLRKYLLLLNSLYLPPKSILFCEIRGCNAINIRRNLWTREWYVIKVRALERGEKVVREARGGSPGFPDISNEYRRAIARLHPHRLPWRFSVLFPWIIAALPVHHRDSYGNVCIRNIVPKVGQVSFVSYWMWLRWMGKFITENKLRFVIIFSNLSFSSITQ